MFVGIKEGGDGVYRDGRDGRDCAFLLTGKRDLGKMLPGYRDLEKRLPGYRDSGFHNLPGLGIGVKNLNNFKTKILKLNDLLLLLLFVTEIFAPAALLGNIWS
jgi:hypothetical protein